MPEKAGDSTNYRIYLRRGDVAVDISSPDPAWLDGKLDLFAPMLSGGVDSRSPEEERRKPEPDRAGKGRSLAEHVRAVAPAGGLEHVLAVGYYLERHSGLRGGFRRRDVADAFRVLRYQHSNPGVPIATARRRGLLMEGQEHEKLQLTETAERWVEDRLAARAG